MKEKKCKVCKEPFIPTYNTLQAVCSHKCAIAHGKKKAKEKAKKEWKKEKEVLRKNVTNWKNELQKEVQKIARYIDFGLTCLARGTNGQMHGGHVFAKGGHPEMRFDLHNIHRQSAHSNTFKNDDGLLRERLAEEYGEEYLESLKDLRRRKVPKHSNEVYHAFYLKARKIANRLKKENNELFKPRSVEERIRLREEINKELGIYEY
jgi:hypothetical protein